MGGTLAIVAMVVLLAAGFGVLGGRPDAEPVPTSVAVAPSAVPGLTQLVGSGASPRVTPWTECGEPPQATPDILLQVNGQPNRGVVEIIEGAIDAPPQGATPSPLPERIDVPVDVVSELWVAGGSCAVAWEVALAGDQVLDVMPNDNRDPAYAAQNRFQLQLGPHVGGDFDLRAVLVFPTLIARATWPIRILTVDEPVGGLHAGDVAISTVPGCDVTLTLATGSDNPLNPCVDDVGDPPGDATRVRPGEQLQFDIDGWEIDAASVTCGGLSGQSFIAQPRPGCNVTPDPPTPFIFDAPSDPGRWTVALSACGSRVASSFSGLNRVCGTWFANIVVED